MACFHGQHNDVKRLLTDIRQKQDSPDPLQAVAVLAAVEGKAKVLQVCFNAGAVADRLLALACSECRSPNPEMDNVIKPYSKQLHEAMMPDLKPDGSFSHRQIDEWFGDIDW